MDSSTLTIVISIAVPVLGLFVAVIAVFYKAEKELTTKVHSLELKIKDLEKKDEVQQFALDQIPKIFELVNRNQKWIDE